jgi:large conductance mechanosensitive channel
MAVGVIIGAAFGKIVSSLVGDVIMPPLGNLLSGVSFSDMAATIGAGPDGAAVKLKYGAFIQTMFDFIIIAFVLFLALKGINRLKKPAAPAPNAPPPAPPRTEVLLEEIRDLLKKQ